MKMDLRRDFADIYAHVVERVRSFDPATNDGPGDPGPVKLIEVGFEYSQAGWVVVVFDTRPDVEPDGEWNSHIEGNELERPGWLVAGEANMDEAITLVQLDGTEVVLPEGSELAEPLGELVKAVLLKARAEGVFVGLPKAPGCELGVEHQDGAYGWPVYEARGEENLAEQSAAADRPRECRFCGVRRPSPREPAAELWCSCQRRAAHWLCLSRLCRVAAAVPPCGSFRRVVTSGCQ